MTISRITLAALGLGALITVAAPSANAGEWNRQTTFLTDVPITIKGKVLQLGHHILRILDSANDRYIVQVYDAEGTRLEITVLGVSTQRADPVNDSAFVFDDASDNSGIPALRAWFYPGRGEGVAFPR